MKKHRPKHARPSRASGKGAAHSRHSPAPARGKGVSGKRLSPPARDDGPRPPAPRKRWRDRQHDAKAEVKPGRGEFHKDAEPRRYFRHEKKIDMRKQKPKPAAPSIQHPNQGVLLWGLHAVREAWLNPKRKCFKLWMTEAGREALAGALGAAALDEIKRPEPQLVKRDELDRLLPPNSVHQGVALEASPLFEVALHEVLEKEPGLIVVLDQVTDPHNVGAILRSAASFGAGAIVMTERNAPSTTGVMAKTASGAAEHVPLVHVVNLARAMKDLREAGYWCVGLAEESERDLSALDLTGRTALVLGAEGDGLRRLTRENCDELARLPTGGPIGILNVSNAAAVALYEVRRQRGQ